MSALPQISDDRKVIWQPQEGSQRIFLSCPIFEVLYEGTRGPGKTDALIMDFCKEIGKGYGSDWTGILFRQTFPQLKDVIKKAQKWIPQIWPAAKYNATHHYWRWPTGETLYFSQFDKEDDYWNYHGHEYPWIGWEELCNWASLNGYKKMFSCCRSSNPAVPTRIRSTANPYGPGHNAVKHRFKLPEYRFTPITDSLDKDGNLEPPRVAIFGHIFENKILLEATPNYVTNIVAAARNEAERRAWLFGDWDIVSGGMFDDVWDSKIHILPNFVIPAAWPVNRSFDWGSSKPFSVGWWAKSDGSDLFLPGGRVMSTVRGDLFRFAEWYGSTGEPNEGLRMLATNVARGIVQREIQWGIHKRVKRGPADTAIFTVEDGTSIAKSMGYAVRIDGKLYPGVRWTHADKRPGSRKMGWERMRTMLENSKPTPEGPREHPGLFVSQRCYDFIRTVPVLPRDLDDPDDVDTDAEDHIGDETRYRVRAVGTGGSNKSRTSGMY